MDVDGAPAGSTTAALGDGVCSPLSESASSILKALKDKLVRVPASDADFGEMKAAAGGDGGTTPFTLPDGTTVVDVPNSVCLGATEATLFTPHCSTVKVSTAMPVNGLPSMVHDR
jgi:hypothetical protein